MLEVNQIINDCNLLSFSVDDAARRWALDGAGEELLQLSAGRLFSDLGAVRWGGATRRISKLERSRLCTGRLGPHDTKYSNKQVLHKIGPPWGVSQKPPTTTIVQSGKVANLCR